MQNNHPKSELPAMKEKAAKDEYQQARQKSIDKERAGHGGGIGNSNEKKPSRR
jgi:hypothetical protein